MLPQDWLAVAILVMAVWLISITAISILGTAIGPFAHLLVGIILIFLGGAVAKFGRPR